MPATPTCTPPAARRSVAPATGVCRWLDDAANGNRCLRISTGKVSHDYEVQEVAGKGYTLYRIDANDEIIAYNIDTASQPGVMACSCPDATIRRQGICKHSRSLAAALAALPF